MNPMAYIKNNRSAPQYWELRDNASTRALQEQEKTEVKAAIKRHNDRTFAKQWGKESYREQRRMEVQKVVEPIVKRLYRVATGTWAGGETFVRVNVGKPGASGAGERAWSSNGKWRGLNARLFVSVQPGWGKYVQGVGLAEAGGLLTTHAKQIGDGIWEATWIEQGRGFELNARNGIICRTSDGSFIHAASMAGVKQILAKRERAAASLAKRDAISQFLSTATVAEIAEQYGSVTVSRKHSLKAGNCPSGTDSLIDRFLAGRKAVTVAELVALRHDMDQRRVKAAIIQAIFDA